jgi:hypothetical protein
MNDRGDERELHSIKFGMVQTKGTRTQQSVVFDADMAQKTQYVIEVVSCNVTMKEEKKEYANCN